MCFLAGDPRFGFADRLNRVKQVVIDYFTPSLMEPLAFRLRRAALGLGLAQPFQGQIGRPPALRCRYQEVQGLW